MLAVITFSGAIAPSPDAREAVLAIVGGTLLTIVLTRPRLRWLEGLTGDSERRQRWAERGLSALAFVMGGYAWATLFLVLQGQIGAEYARLVKGAGLLIVLYAGLIHFEPFIEEMRRRGAVAAGILYAGCAFLFIGFGVALAEALRAGSLETKDIWVIVFAAACAAVCVLAHIFMPRLDPRVDETTDPSGPLISSADTASVTVTSTPTRTPAPPTRA